MARADLLPTALRIDKVIDRIAEGDIKIPAFQRGFIWDQDQVVKLIDSVYHNYPIGSILLWNSHERLKSTRNVAGFEIPDREVTYPVNYVLDGQQRLSTIYAVFCKLRTPVATAGQYGIDHSIFDISFDLADRRFLPCSAVPQGHPSLRLQILFDTEALFAAMETLTKDEKKLVRDLHSRFNNYELPLVTISGRTKNEVGIIFERINNSGEPLTTLDLMVAWTWSEDFHLQEKLNDLTEVLDAKGFGDVPERVILQSLSGNLRGSTGISTILGLGADEVRDNFDKLQESLSRAIDFLSTEINISSRSLLPHVQQVVGLAHFFSLVKTPSADQLKNLKRWFWRTAFSTRYSAQTDDKMDEDIKFFKQAASHDFSGLGKYSYSADTTSLAKQKLSKSNPYARAFLLLLAQKNPLNLVNGAQIDLGEALSDYNRKEYHHIFPRAFLKNTGRKSDEISSICNFTFLPSSANKKISSREPKDYINNLVPPAKRKDIFESNLMPVRMEIYDQNDYSEFVKRRSELAVQFLDSLIA
ncbi:MAG TPA: DUF262 domain-containing protein [Verrucomicrobiae bacterium]|nr:DUF262 domain-containing protein [Verrucomicrobiae bacterium]